MLSFFAKRFFATSLPTYTPSAAQPIVNGVVLGLGIAAIGEITGIREKITRVGEDFEDARNREFREAHDLLLSKPLVFSEANMLCKHNKAELSPSSSKVLSGTSLLDADGAPKEVLCAAVSYMYSMRPWGYTDADDLESRANAIRHRAKAREIKPGV